MSLKCILVACLSAFFPNPLPIPALDVRPALAFMSVQYIAFNAFSVALSLSLSPCIYRLYLLPSLLNLSYNPLYDVDSMGPISVGLEILIGFVDLKGGTVSGIFTVC